MPAHASTLEIDKHTLYPYEHIQKTELVVPTSTSERAHIVTLPYPYEHVWKTKLAYLKIDEHTPYPTSRSKRLSYPL